MGMGAVTGLMTFEEFERLPEHEGKQELLEGELIELPPPKKRHNIIAKRLFMILNPVVETIRSQHQEPALGEAFMEMGYRITREPDSWFIPDVSVTHPDQRGDEYYDGAPLLAIEVISEANTAREVARRVKLYLQNGAREVWVVYPNEAYVWVYRDTTGRLVEDRLTTDLIPSLSIDLPSALQ